MINLTSETRLLNNIRPDILAMSAYHVPDASGLIKLDAMENPYVLPDELKAKLGARLAALALNRYPVPTYSGLVTALRAYAHIPESSGVMLGNGSDELIHLLSMAVSKAGERVTVLAPAPSFVMYRASALLNHVDYVEVDLQKRDGVNGVSFQLDVPAMTAAISTHRPALVYLPYPNNPTGAAFERADMLAVMAAAQAVGALVAVDEAYQPFADFTWMSELARFEHMLVVRTVSKLGLAGVRLGYMAGGADLIAELDKVRPPYNINVLTEAAVSCVLEHVDVLEAQAQQIRETRAVLVSALQSMKGVRPFDTQANFVLVEFERDANEVFEGLKARGVLVKNMTKAHPMLSHALRLTVGSQSENAQLLDALNDILK
ncbi:histidinol-phosphate transaminase [Hydromonas duriensis]|uniref:Histidinol-phosphate aminotransferase n=1 Tax=Hydromonas duriensis TaxID=1527608 RepID=A0A4R6Y7Q3_9BURK|nr:histidinol-phosphate transaminase [Hydromonas duriensis]TDR31366.1 histidinol phosphate aminotransferase [Hydromonas duriensis]